MTGAARTTTAAEVFPLRLSEFVYPPQHPLAGAAGTVYGYAIRHSAGILLFDTGVGSGHAWIDEHYRPRTRAIDDALREAGLDPARVTAIAHSHLHFDHCGQDARFAGVPIYVQQVELEAARAEGYTVPEWAFFGGARHVALEGDAELAPGVRLLATPGHTAGHQSAAIATPAGLVVLAGHAVDSAADWRAGTAGADASEEALASAARLRALAPRRVYFAHDPAVWTAG